MLMGEEETQFMLMGEEETHSSAPPSLVSLLLWSVSFVAFINEYSTTGVTMNFHVYSD